MTHSNLYDDKLQTKFRSTTQIGNATLIGGHAIRLRLNPNFHSPNIAGYHLYNSSTQLIETVPNYELAITTAQPKNLIIVWRNDLNSPSVSL